MVHQVSARAVLDLWFGQLDPEGCAPPEKVTQWFKKDAAFDARLLEDFAETHAALMAGDREWLGSARGVLASVIVLDQFSRNMFRGTAQMYQGDARALELASQCIAEGGDAELGGELRTFLYMPFMHSEALNDQDECVRLFRAFHDSSRGALKERLANNLEYAIAHRDIVARFGRFPHRNAQCQSVRPLSRVHENRWHEG